VFAVCMGKQSKGDSAIVDLGRANYYRLAFPVICVWVKPRAVLPICPYPHSASLVMSWGLYSLHDWWAGLSTACHVIGISAGSGLMDPRELRNRILES